MKGILALAKLTLLPCLFLTWAGELRAQDDPFAEPSEQQMVLAHYMGDDYNWMGVMGLAGAQGHFVATTRMDKEKMGPFAGNRLTYVRFALCSDQVEQVRVWAAHTRDGERLLEQDVESVQTGWNTVRLAKPLDLTDDDLYVGFEFTNNTSARVITYHSTTGESSLDIRLPGGEWVERTVYGTLALQCLAEGDCLPQHDGRLTRINLNGKYYRGDGLLHGQVTFQNIGKQPIESYDYCVSIDREQVLTGTQTAEIGTFGSVVGDWSVGVPADLDDGPHTVTVCVSRINGEAPQYTQGDTVRSQFVFYTTAKPRQKALLEHCTGLWCSNCPVMDDAIEELKAQRSDFVVVGLQSQDALSVTKGEVICNVLTGALPAFFYDRYAPEGATSFYPSSVDYALSVPAFISLELSATRSEDNWLTITVCGNAVEHFDRIIGDMTLTVMLTEDGIVMRQSDSRQPNGYVADYVHNNVLRACLTEAWGDAVMLGGDGRFERTFTVRLDDDWVPDEMHIVAYLTRPFTGRNFSDAGVLNCEQIDVRELASTDIRTIGSAATEEHIYTLAGRYVGNDLTTLPRGIYIRNGRKVVK